MYWQRKIKNVHKHTEYTVQSPRMTHWNKAKQNVKRVNTFKKKDVTIEQ